ncbi:DUF5131 family protein [Candidatus Latescibacterota bacterium]
MSINSKIEWTQTTWNPVTGCTKFSSGCKNCYAERMAKRLKAMGCKAYINGFGVTIHEHILVKPLKWRKSKMVFVNSMSDLFHEDVSDKFIIDVINIMKDADWHIFQLLTKRSKRLNEFSKKVSWPKNVWIGVSIESEEYINRIEDIRNIDAKIKFISFEPLLSQIKSLNFHGIDWIIVGGESGPKARNIKKSWVFDILKQCKNYNIPFFFKQWGGTNKKKTGRLLDGKLWNEMPVF